jgi:hypothetical protein
LPEDIGSLGGLEADPPAEADRRAFGIITACAILLELRGRSVPQSIRVSWTPCKFGGIRPWLHCPQGAGGLLLPCLLREPHL